MVFRGTLCTGSMSSLCALDRTPAIGPQLCSNPLQPVLSSRGFRKGTNRLQLSRLFRHRHGLLSNSIIHVGRQSLVKSSTNRVPTGIVASLADNARPQEKQKQSFEDFLPDFDGLSKDELQSYLNLELQSDLDTDTYKHYEIMFIIHEKNVDEVQAVKDKVTGFVLENKGFIYRINDWGLRRLAYKIRKAEKGNYVLMNIEIGSGVINDLNSMFEKDERVIRHMVISQKEAVSDDMQPPEEWRPSGAFAEGGEVEEEEEEVYEEDEEEEEEEEREGQRNGELILERQQ